VATLHQRNRIVIFRLTQAEYDSLKSACSEAGARNLSDFTRTELLDRIKADDMGSAIERRFLEIDRKLGDLCALIQRVSEQMTSSAPLVAAAHAGGGDD
jgi:hypothetical protein